MSRVWLTTGANSGFGRAITEAAVAAGDVVVAGARRLDALDDLTAAYPDQVEALLAELSSRQRAIVKLRWGWGLPREEIAGALGMTPRAVKRDVECLSALLRDQAELIARVAGVSAAGVW